MKTMNDGAQALQAAAPRTADTGAAIANATRRRANEIRKAPSLDKIS
jgi:hypothetical protein